MAKQHGYKAAFSLDGVELRTFLTNVSEDLARDAAETSAMGQEAKTFVSGQYGGTISLSGWYDPTDATGPDDTLFGLLQSGAEAPFVYGPHGGDAGDARFTGACLVTAYAVSAPVEDTVGFTATLQVTGAVTRDVYPA